METHLYPQRMAATRILVVLICIATSQSAAAQQASDDAARAQARDLGAAGIDDYEAGRLVEADKKLERAFGLYAAPTIGLWSARTRVQLGRWVEAADRYRAAGALSSAIGDSETQAEAKREAEQELSALMQRIPTLTIKLDDPGAANLTLQLDDAQLTPSQLAAPVMQNPGAHKLVARRGGEVFEKLVQLKEKERATVTVTFQAAPKPFVAPNVVARTATSAAEGEDLTKPQGALKPLGIVGLSIGALGLVIAGGSAIAAADKLKLCKAESGNHLCDTRSQLDAYNTAKTVATVAFWTGAAFAVGGGIALLVNARGKQPTEQSLSLSVHTQGVELRGAF